MFRYIVFKYLAVFLLSAPAKSFFWDYGDIYDAVEFDPFNVIKVEDEEDVIFPSYDYGQDYRDTYHHSHQHHDTNSRPNFWPDYADYQYPDLTKDPYLNYVDGNDHDFLSLLNEDLVEAANEFTEENKEHHLFDYYDHALTSKDRENDHLPILHRRKRASKSKSSSSRSKSSTSRWGSKAKATPTSDTYKPSEEKLSKGKASSSSSKSGSGSQPYPTGYYPPKPGNSPDTIGQGNALPKPGYPTGTIPGGSNYPINQGSIVPKPGYPTGTIPGGSSYPTNQGSYVPKPGYPTGTIPGGSSYPTNQGSIMPKPGYPTGTIPGGSSYPTNQGNILPKPGYPTGNYPPHSGYPSAGQPGFPGGAYPGGGVPKPGYPSGTHSGYPGGSYNTGMKPGYPGAYPGTHTGSAYPSFATGGMFPNKPKITKKEKVKQVVKHAVEAYATYKLSKKRSKYLSPSHMPGMGFGGFGGSHHGGGMSKFGKKVIGTAMKLIIARYAMKFGINAAKAYFEYKLGRELEDVVIEKFISRYHRQRTRNLFRHNRRFKETQKNGLMMNITLGEDCSRECKMGDVKTCFFSFEVHLYQSLSRACYKCPDTPSDCERPECIVGSGRRKLMTVVNKQLSGPTIQVCEGDTVLLEVQNSLPSSGVTLHFRGQSYPGTPFMEGTPGMTQCPISAGSTFTYTFVAKEPGTHFWHSQTGFTRSDGVYGPFIVQEINSNQTYPNLYDIDLTKQTILISEDFEKSGEDQYVDLYSKTGKFNIHSLLINGKGRKLVSESSDLWKLPILYSRIDIETGKRHRLRLISSVSSNCPVTFNLIGQTVSVIAIDGSPVSPKEAKTILLSPGDTYDVVVESLARGLYWVEFKGFQDCDGLLQYAIIESQDPTSINETNYKKMMNLTNVPTKFELPLTNPKMLDPAKELSKSDIINCNNSVIHCSQNFTSSVSMEQRLSAPPNFTLYFSLTNRRVHNEHFYSLLYYDIRSMPMEEQMLTPQINNLTLKLPPTPLLIDEGPLKREFCSTIGVRRQQCVEDFCECIHLQELPLNFIVDLVFINEGKDNSHEPQTLFFHGHRFWVLSQDNTLNLTIPEQESLSSSNQTATNPNSTAESNSTADINSTSTTKAVDANSEQYIDRMTVVLKDSEGTLKRNLINPILKNSVTVPSGGYSIIRFETKNPGFWLLESSSVFKSAAGMGLVFRIGNSTDFPKASKKLGKC